MPPIHTVPFWRRTPPAVFPPIMGLFGLGLAWRQAATAFGPAAALADLILGAATLIFLFAAAAYGAKLLRRPAVLPEDLRILPGRAGLAAMSLSTLLLAAALVPRHAGLATVLLFAGLVAHAGLAVLVIRALLRGPAEQRRVTPAWHLAFVGFIVAPLSAIPLGYVGFAQVVVAVTVVFAALTYAVSLVQLARRPVPAPLRPLLTIHLAPVSLFGTAAVLLEMTATAFWFGVAASLGLLLLLGTFRYLTAAGFGPLWGAFTFPLAACAGLTLALGAAGAGAAFHVAGGLALVAATLINPAVAYRVLRLWANGGLAAKTNAAVA